MFYKVHITDDPGLWTDHLFYGKVKFSPYGFGMRKNEKIKALQALHDAPPLR